MDLPPLGDTPRRYPDFCLSISTRLIRALTDIITTSGACKIPDEQQSSLVVSVGSGSGLLEAHLQSFWSSIPSCNLTIEGVEVRTAGDARPVNRYLSEEHHTTVRGTFEVTPRGRQASALMFVYPREPMLIQRYLQGAREDEDSPLRTVVWLGPKADWDCFAECLRDVPRFGEVEIPDDCGMVKYEMMAIIRRLPGS